MYSSVKSFVPIRIGSAAVVRTLAVVVCGGVATSSPPQAPRPRAAVARTASPSARANAISGARPGGCGLVLCGHALLDSRQREVEDAALSRRAGHPDPAAVLVDDALADRQADARAGVGLLAV